ncbi:MAG: nucleotidyltransferase domain-containing protein [Actinomycetota bacterium]
MADPGEGLDDDGVITTSARTGRAPDAFRPIVRAAVDAIRAEAPTASAYLYGSAATGQASSPKSDVDILTIGLDEAVAAQISSELSATFRGLCRAVEIATGSMSDFVGDSDAAYGGRVFLHHYCVHLLGVDLDSAAEGFRGDRRAARGFNGDIDRHLAVWRESSGSIEPTELGRRVARKTLLATAGLVSVHDVTWTTDRGLAAHRWSDVHPPLRAELVELLAWSDGAAAPTQRHLDRALDGIISTIVEQFADSIGLWPRSAV